MTDIRTQSTIPTEQLLAQTDDPTQPGIYVLELDSPGPSLQGHARRWWREYQAVHPDDVAGLAGTERVLYVGAAANLQERLEDHVQGDVRKSTWLTVYPPVELVLVSPSPSADHAFEHETQAAHRIADMVLAPTAVVCDGEVVG
jgi:hypothetical protein